MKLIIVLLGLVALADVVVSYPECCPEGKDTWCFDCESPMDDCCISIGFPVKCNPGETCYHHTAANGRSKRGCKPIDECPEQPVICAPGQLDCLECRCDDPKFHEDIQDREVSQCEDPDYVFPYHIPWCYGDPHVKTCDGKIYSLDNVDCCHVFIRDNCSNGVPVGESKFSISICLDPTAVLKRGQIAKKAWITYRNLIIFVNPNIGTYKYNGVTYNTKAFPDKRYFGTTTEVTYFETLSILCVLFINDDIRIYWDYRGGLSVWIPKKDEFNGKMCGLAGNCDGIAANDLICGLSHNTDGQCTKLDPADCPTGSIVNDPTWPFFGMSWYHSNTGSVACSNVCQ